VNFSLRHARAIIFGTLAFWLMLGVEPSKALDDLKVYRGVLVLEGQIVSGDYDRLRNFLSSKSNFDKISNGVFIASQGGNVVEAMKMGRLIRTLRLSTDAPSGPATGIPRFGESLIQPYNLVNPRANYVCVSACFFVYVAGIYRHLSWVGRLGVHRPTISEGIARPTLGDDKMKSATWFVHETIKNYLRDMDVPDKYLDLIYSVPPTTLRWITQAEFDSDLQGFIPELNEWANCGQHARRGEINYDELKNEPSLLAKTQDFRPTSVASANQASGLAKCWMRAKTELPKAAWHKVFFSN
jgi:hypothetical protein